MNREEAVSLVEYISKISPSGSRSANYVAINPWSTFVVKEINHTYNEAVKWGIPGLFVAYGDLDPAKPWANIVYCMKSGEVLWLCLPTSQATISKLPIKILKYGMFKGMYGFWVALDNWHKVADQNKLVLKRGTVKKTHHARRATSL
jgi:hypothetical protein